MNWYEKLSDDNKNNLVAVSVVIGALILAFWSKGYFNNILNNTTPDSSILSSNYNLNSIEQKLIVFLTDTHQLVNEEEGSWFDFDQVNFASGTSDLTVESEIQLKNIASIILKFPNATFKTGSYTDNVGDEESNLKLSQLRAEVVLYKLIALGVSENQLTGAEGYGSQHAIADNNTEEGRLKNRRVSLRIKSK